MGTVAGVTFANGGDNIGVYTPVFLSVEPLAVVAYCVIFLVLVAVLVALAKFVATRPPRSRKCSNAGSTSSFPSFSSASAS
ncbi:Cadmium resistance transporter [Corynebacterium belfantii]|nr:Cadmium resistance transporter [Corynebacterium belfantii]